MDALMEKLHKLWKLVFANGVINLFLGLGILFPVLPLFTSADTHDIFARRLAIFLLIGAFVVASYALKVQPGKQSVNGLVLAVIRVITALLLLFHPLDNYLTLHVLVAIYFGLEGALAAGEATKVRNIRILFLPFSVIAVTGIILSAMLWLYLANASYFVVSTIFALAFLVRGGVLIYTALRVKNYQPAGTEPPPAAPSDTPAPAPQA